MSEVLKKLEPLIQQAEREGKLLESTVDPALVFTPAELRQQNAGGSFRWGPVNWRLLDVDLYLKGFDGALKRAQENRAKAYRRMGREP